MEQCGNCEFWKEHKSEGTCSQKIKTNNGFTEQITCSDYGCVLYEEDIEKFNFRLYINKENKVIITGTFSKNTIMKAIEFLQNKLEKYK